MWTRSSRDSWERLVVAVIKREQIRQLCHQDSITTVDSSDFSQRGLSLRSVHSSPSQLSLTKDFAVEVRKNGSGITQKLFSAMLWRKKPKDYDVGEGLVGIPDDHFGLESISLRELQVATDHFNNKNLIGHGGFGKLYKGRLEDGSLVVVKRLAQVMIGEEFEISSIVAHRNVIGLRGFCSTENERLLVYPYMANGSVASCLRERHDSQPRPLEWASRLRIALGVARGLDHLHHGCIRGIIHGEVQAANILLDDDFEAVISDFTFAKFMDGINDNGVRGTIGHIASEYLSTGKCSLETDVFSYGVFLLELITRQRAFDLALLGNDEDTLLPHWVKKFLEEKKIETVIQQDLEGNFVKEEVKKLLQIALICTQTDQEGHRPTMSEIVRILEDADGLAEVWEEFSKNVNQDQNYLSSYNSFQNGMDDDIAPDGIDVYGYGTFLLELITAQRVFDLARLANHMTLPDWVKKLLEEKKFEIMVDRDLEGNFVEEEVEKLLRIALICRQNDPMGRPTMSEVVRMLEDGDG